MVQTEMPTQITLLLLLPHRDIAMLDPFLYNLFDYYDNDSRCDDSIFYFSIHLTMCKQRLNDV